MVNESINERIKNLGMIAAFYDRAGGMKNIPSDKALPVMLGIFTFILSKMLDGEKGATMDEIMAYVMEYYTSADFQPEREHITQLIMRMMYQDRESGIPFQYYDFINNKTEQIKYNFLKIEHSSSQEASRIALTKTGRDMLFQTREIYQELRITMDLLFIKEQFKRGAFTKAIRSAESLKTSVGDSLEAKEKLIFEIRRAPWRVNTKSLAESYEDIKHQFQKESEMFDELLGMIRNVSYEGLETKNTNSLVKLEEILNHSRLLHEKLLSLHMSIMPEYLNFRNKNTLRLLFGEIHFNADLIDPLFQAQTEAIDPTLMSFVPKPRPLEFFPWLSITRNPVERSRRKKEKIQLIQEEQDHQDRRLEQAMRQGRIELTTYILRQLKTTDRVLLSQIIDVFEPNDNLLAFVIGLHQVSEIAFKRTKDSDILTAVKDAQPRFKGLKVYTVNRIIRKRGYVFSDYVFEKDA